MVFLLLFLGEVATIVLEVEAVILAAHGSQRRKKSEPTARKARIHHCKSSSEAGFRAPARVSSTQKIMHFQL